LANYSADTLLGWFLYYQIEPWGYELDNIRHGIVTKNNQSSDDQFNIANSICQASNIIQGG
jgi:hypothetical protein